jgi:hypothetical protein
LERDLSERYNAGLVSPPQLGGELARLQRPAWQPTLAQIEAARKSAWVSVAVLALLVIACLATLVLLMGWKP